MSESPTIPPRPSSRAVAVTEGQDIGFDFEESTSPSSKESTSIGSEGLGISGTPQVPARPIRGSSSTPEVPARPSIPPRPAKKTHEEPKSESGSSSPEDVVRPVPVVPQRPAAKDQSMPSVPPRPQRASSEDTSGEDTGSSASVVGREYVTSPPVVPSRPIKRPTTSGSSNSESSATGSTPSIPPRPTRALPREDSAMGSAESFSGGQPPDPRGPLRGDMRGKDVSDNGVGESSQGEKEASIEPAKGVQSGMEASIGSGEGDRDPLRGYMGPKTDAVNEIAEDQTRSGSMLSSLESDSRNLDEKDAIEEKESSMAEEKESADKVGEPEPTPVVPPRPADRVEKTPQSGSQEKDKQPSSESNEEEESMVTPVVPPKSVETEGKEEEVSTSNEMESESSATVAKDDSGVAPVVPPIPVSEEKESDIGSTEKSKDRDASPIASDAKDSVENNPEPMLEESTEPIPPVDVQEDSEKTSMEPPQPSDALHKSTAVDVDSLSAAGSTSAHGDEFSGGQPPDPRGPLRGDTADDTADTQGIISKDLDDKERKASETEKELLKTETIQSDNVEEPVPTQKESADAQDEQSISTDSKVQGATESKSIPEIPSRPSKSDNENLATETVSDPKPTPQVPSRPSKSKQPSSEDDEASTKEKSAEEPTHEPPSNPSRPSKSNTDNETHPKGLATELNSSAKQSPGSLGAVPPENKPDSRSPENKPVIPPRPTSREAGRAGSIESIGSDTDGRQSAEPELVEQLPSKTAEKAVEDEDDDIQEVKVVTKATPEVPARPTATKGGEGRPAPPPKPKKLPINSKVGALRASLFNDLNQVISAGGRRPPGVLAKDQGDPDQASEAKTLKNKEPTTTKEEEEEPKAPPAIPSTRRRAKGPQRRLPTAAKSEWSTVINDVWSLYIPASSETTAIAPDAKEEPEVLMHETDQESIQPTHPDDDADSGSNYSSANESAHQDPDQDLKNEPHPNTSHPDDVPAATADPNCGYAPTTMQEQTTQPQIETHNNQDKDKGTNNDSDNDSNQVSDNTVL
ncbi:hypothetical protein TRICI_000610 [Trichomonascus ciferrii]|uniref:Altered inheritance of mitochondria protein 21 n=1 Tax=Trichomonascus ciferrii TaxID=44093 RepID=A0A642VBV6_9ASCO|nr:hypothetical protein TRICI_000610 [Trichomonascus ciferrii]